MAAPFEFPRSFLLPDICRITGHVFELKESALQLQAKEAMEPWFKKFQVYDSTTTHRFLSLGQFDLFAALSFPEADLAHLNTCLAFFYWAFSTDDLSDEGALQSKPESVKRGVDISKSVLYNLAAETPTFPYAAMLLDLRRKMKVTASPGTCNRFAKAFIEWSDSQVQQSSNRSQDRLPPLDEFIIMRRATIGAAMVEAMVEYSLDLDIPDYVFEHPIIRAMSDCTSDIMTWPNDLCSFNKEQADGDYSNMVCIVMSEQNVDLQTAVDIIADMLAQRVADYVKYKTDLPSFGPEVDVPLARYIKALEQFVQGTIVWYYKSPRYFKGVDALNREASIDLFGFEDQ